MASHSHTCCTDDAFKDCPCWTSENARPPPAAESAPKKVRYEPRNPATPSTLMESLAGHPCRGRGPLRLHVRYVTARADGSERPLLTESPGPAGQSKKFPFCDGSHSDYNAKNGTSLNPQPVRNDTEKDKDFYFCMCGHSGKRPLCDGTHKRVKTA